MEFENPNYGWKLNELYNNEINNISKLNHKNLLKIFESWEDKNFRFQVIEYIDGCNLSEYLKK